MAIEISNALHAMAVVNPGTTPSFFGQGNVGFAAFGVGPQFSERRGPGKYRLHMLGAIDFGGGEGIVTPVLFDFSQGFPLTAVFRIDIALPNIASTDAPSPGFDILVQTVNGNGDPTDHAFMVAVLRFPQQSTETG